MASPAFGDGIVTLADGSVERADSLVGTFRKQVAHRLKREHQALHALQQGVVQFASDTRALIQARFGCHAEFPLQLPDTKLVGRPQQCQKSAHAERAEPACLVERR